MSARPILVTALGGNALIGPGQRGTATEQLANLRSPMRQLARLAGDWRLVITHGNGPQVGNLLLQQEACEAVPPLPLEVLVAQTQGQIGYLIESTLDAELATLGVTEPLLVSLVSYVVVDPADPAFHHPDKPVGPVYSEARVRELPFPTVRTAKGWRRVVASPEPVTVVEKREVRRLLAEGFIVVCCGGGGIPVSRQGRRFAGVEAVIDKDLASARLCAEIDADMLLIATDVEGVCRDFGTPRQQVIHRLRLAEAEALLRSGELPAGSMAPKVEAAVRMVRCGGRAVICHLDGIEAAVAGEAGTEIVP